MTILEAEKIYCLPENLYFYRMRIGSSINSYSDNNFCIFNNIKEIEDYLNKKGLNEEFKKDFIDFKIKILANHYKRIPSTSVNKFKEECLKIIIEKEFQKMLNITRNKSNLFKKII